MRTYFIAGTDTGVGKTVVAAAMAACLADEGLSVAVMKPVACGSDEDARLLKHCANSPDPLETVMPIFLKKPLSPNVAASQEARKLDIRAIKRSCQAILRRNPDVLIVEGCGGLLVPITERFFVVDLIPLLKARTILVSRSGLGAINHSLLSLEALRHRKIEPLGIVFNRLSGGSLSVPEKTNPGVIAKMGRVNSLGVFPFISTELRRASLARAARKHIDLKKILC